MLRFVDKSARLPHGNPAMCSLVGFVTTTSCLTPPMPIKTSRRGSTAYWNTRTRSVLPHHDAGVCGDPHRPGQVRLAVVVRFREFVNNLISKRLAMKKTTGFPAGRMKTNGILGDVVRAYILAAMWAARNSIVELLKPRNFRMSQITETAEH